MPKRHCGEYTIHIDLHECRETEYVCRVSHEGDHLGTQAVRTPKNLTTAIDSPEAFDRAAHAAMSFFSEDSDAFDGELAELEGQSWVIRRQRTP